MKTNKAAPRPIKAAYAFSGAVSKIFSAHFLTAVALVITFLCAAAVPNVIRAEGKKVCFEMNSIENITPGSEFEVTLDLTGDFEMQCANLGIEFDPAALELIDVEQGDLLTDAIPSQSGFFILEYKSIAVQGIIKLGITMAVDPLTTAGRIMTMKFRLKEGTKINQQIVLNVYQLIGRMPIGEMHGTPCEYETKNSIVRISGGTDPQESFNLGQSGTPIPGFTPPPTYIDNTSDPVDPTIVVKPLPTLSASGDPASSNGLEGGTIDPAATIPGYVDASGDQSEDPKGMNPIIYVLIVAAVLAVCIGIFVTSRKKDPDEKEGLKEESKKADKNDKKEDE